MRHILLYCGLLSTATLFACKPRIDEADSKVLTNQSNPNEMAVDVNDLSYLLPRNAAGQIYPEIRVASSWADVRTRNGMRPTDDDASNPILTKAVYDSLVEATANQANFGQKTNSLKTPFKADEVEDFEHESFVITSFRIDPCAPSLALDKGRTNYQNPLSQTVVAGVVQQINKEISDLFKEKAFQLAACQTQLRLILQPVSADRATIKESTIHMVFTLNAGAGVMNDTLQADVQGLKKKLQDVTGVDTTGYLLQPHPGLQTEASANQDSSKSGPAGKAIIEYLSAVLHDAPNPQVMAAIREKIVNGVQYDVVLGGGVADPRKGPYTAGPLVGSSSKNGFIIVSDANRRTWRMDPQPTRNTPVFDNLITFDPDQIDSPQDTALMNMMKKDDPESTHFFVNDCVTCHGTSQAFKQLPNLGIAAASAPRYRVPAGVSGFPIGSFLPPAPQGSGDKVIGVALRNFGYSHGQPVIGLRTVTETAALADYFNRDLRRINNPGAACAGEAEQKAWIAAIGMGTTEGNPAYAFAKGSSAREDQLFQAAGCTAKVADNSGLGARGDGANASKVGTIQSPIFSKMSFEGTGTTPAGSGPMTLVLAAMGQAIMSVAPKGQAPESSIGSWSYITDTVTRGNQIKVTMDDGSFLLAMSGVGLCEIPVKDQKTRLNGCLALQAGWAKGIKIAPTGATSPGGAAPTPTPKPVVTPPAANPEAPVALYESGNCSGSPKLRVGAKTDCAKASGKIMSVRVDGARCETFATPVSADADGAAQACERVKAGGADRYWSLYFSDTCEVGMLVAFIANGTNCKALDAQGLNQIYGTIIKGKCEDIVDTSFDEICTEHVVTLKPGG